jgi:hypothetical protein
MPEGERKPFAAFLHEQRRGALHGELSEKLQELVLAVEEHRKAGTLTLTLSVKPFGDGTVAITDKIVVKAPEGERGSGIFFADEDGNLSRDDPRQTRIEDVIAERRAARAAGDE